MRTLSFFFILFIASSFSSKVFSQDFLEFSGLVVQEEDTITPVAFARLGSIKTGKGTIADEEGFFYILAERTDTIVFSAIGFKQYFIPIQESTDTKNLFVVIPMKTDTVRLSGVDILPFYSQEEFRQAMLSLNIEEVTIMKAITKEEIDKIANIKYSTDGLKIRGPITTIYNFFKKKGKENPKNTTTSPPKKLPVFKKGN